MKLIHFENSTELDARKKSHDSFSKPSCISFLPSSGSQKSPFKLLLLSDPLFPALTRRNCGASAAQECSPPPRRPRPFLFRNIVASPIYIEYLTVLDPAASRSRGLHRRMQLQAHRNWANPLERRAPRGVAGVEACQGNGATLGGDPRGRDQVFSRWQTFLDWKMGMRWVAVGHVARIDILGMLDRQAGYEGGSFLLAVISLSTGIFLG